MKRTNRQRGKYVRNKGHSFERAVANKLKDWKYPSAKRHLESQKDEAAKGIDLENTGSLAIQCKAYANYAPINKIEEVNIPDSYAALVTKGNNKKPVIVMYLDDFIKYVDEQTNQKENGYLQRRERDAKDYAKGRQ